MTVYVFRSLPLSADSRTSRNCSLFYKDKSITCTFEKVIKSNLDSHIYCPVTKTGGRYLKAIKYLIFIMWVVYVVVFKAKRNDTLLFMDLETIFLAGYFANLKGCFTIFDIVDPSAQTKKFPKIILPIVNRFELFWANKCDLLMVPHESRLTYYQDMINKTVSNESLMIVENVPSFESCNLVKEKSSGNSVSIGYYGTLDSNSRGIEELLSLAIDNVSVVLHVAGQGAMSKVIENMAITNSNIHFHGSFSFEELPELYSYVDFMWAYYTPENILHKYAAPNKFYEHLYFGVPMITSSIIPQARTLCQLGSGIFVDLKENSIDDIYSKIMLFIDSSKFSSEELSKFWHENYEGYYSKVKMELYKHLPE